MAKIKQMALEGFDGKTPLDDTGLRWKAGDVVTAEQIDKLAALTTKHPNATFHVIAGEFSEESWPSE